VPVPVIASASSPTMTDPGAGKTPVSVPKPQDPVDRDTTQTEDGDIITATGETSPSPRSRAPEIDTGVRTFVHRPGEVSSVRIGEHARAARAASFTPPTAALVKDGPPAEDRTRPTKVLAGGTPSRAVAGGSKKIVGADTGEMTVPDNHPALSDPEGIITQLPTSKPRGKRRTTGRQPLHGEGASDGIPTSQLRQSSSRILPLPPPKADEPLPEPGLPFDDSDDGDDDIDITEVDSTTGKKFDDLLSLGVAKPVANAPLVPVEVPLAPPRPPELQDAATEVEDVEELSRIDVIEATGGRRRIWIVGGVAVVASALVALSMVWALDASSRDGGEADQHPSNARALPAALPHGELAPAPAAVQPEPAPIAEKPEGAPPPEEHQKQKPAKVAVTPAPPKKKAPPATSEEPAAETAPAAPSASPAQLYKEGAQLTLAGKLPEAQKKYIAALRVSPGYAPALRGLGLVYEKSGQKAKAIKSLQAYLRLAPKAADAGAIRARIERLRN